MALDTEAVGIREHILRKTTKRQRKFLVRCTVRVDVIQPATEPRRYRRLAGCVVDQQDAAMNQLATVFVGQNAGVGTQSPRRIPRDGQPCRVIVDVKVEFGGLGATADKSQTGNDGRCRPARQG